MALSKIIKNDDYVKFVKSVGLYSGGFDYNDWLYFKNSILLFQVWITKNL